MSNSIIDRTDYRACPEEALVVASLVGYVSAFDELIRRYRVVVLHIARQTGVNHTVAEDIAQEVFLAAFQSLPNLDEPAKFGAWLRSIARFRSLRVAERERRSTATDALELETLIENRTGNATADDSNPASVHLRQAEKERVWSALTWLSVEHREVLVLHYAEEWSLSRIADSLSLPETTIKGRLFRAREALRRLLTTDSLESK